MEGRDILKYMAQQAKNRLRGKDINAKQNIKTIDVQDDEKLYFLVKKTVDDNCVNPLAELIDIRYYKTLTSEQKERYFFMLADKYRTLKQRYEREKLKQVNWKILHNKFWCVILNTWTF